MTPHLVENHFRQVDTLALVHSNGIRLGYPEVRQALFDRAVMADVENHTLYRRNEVSRPGSPA